LLFGIIKTRHIWIYHIFFKTGHVWVHTTITICYTSTFSNAAGISPPAAVFRANTIRNDKEIIIE
jgi:hypothetical protein